MTQLSKEIKYNLIDRKLRDILFDEKDIEVNLFLKETFEF